MSEIIKQENQALEKPTLRFIAGPGWAVAFMGFLAAAYTALPSEMPLPGWARGLLIFGFFALLVAELMAITRERNKHEAESAADRKSTQDRFEQTMERFKAVQQIADSHQQSIVRLMNAFNDPAAGLKRRALELSERLLDFIYDRIQNLPPLPRVLITTFRNLDDTPEMQELAKYEHNTMAVYNTRFAAKVKAIRDEFAAQGLIDEPLESLYDDVQESGYIRIIGERIGVLAEQITAKTA